MARILAIDWDQRTLHIVAANVGRKSVRVEKAFTLPLDEDLTPSNGESVGRKFRDLLKAKGCAPANVLACVGRDRVLIKEIEYPQVPESEEPGLVRFQATKDLVDTAEDMVIDYCSMRSRDLPGPRQAMVAAVKRSAVSAMQAFCRGAGLKLDGLSPRTFAWKGALDRAVGGTDVRALIGIGERWSELVVLEGSQVVFTRALPTSNAFPTEVARNLTLFATRTGQSPSQVYVLGHENENALAGLTEELDGLLQPLPPFKDGDEVVPASHKYAAAAGLAFLSSQSATLPINWASPKQPKPVVNRKRERVVVYAGIAFLALAFGFFMGYYNLSMKKRLLDELQKEQVQLTKQLKNMEEDRENNEAIREWEEATISWLDELYDFSARFPNQLGLYLIQLNAKVNAGPGVKKGDAYVASMNVSGVVPSEYDSQIRKLLKNMQDDKHLRISAGKNSVKAGKTGEFEFSVEITKQPHSEFHAKLEVPKNAKDAKDAKDLQKDAEKESEIKKKEELKGDEKKPVEPAVEEKKIEIDDGGGT